MTDRTGELFDHLHAQAFYPDAAHRQVLRSIGSDPVLGFVVLPSEHRATPTDTPARQVRVGVITPRRLIHVAWCEEPADLAGDLEDLDAADVAGQVERFLAEALKGSPAPAATAPSGLVVAARTVPVRSLVDVRTSHTYPAHDADAPVDTAQVVALSPTLDTLTLVPLSCGDPDCEGEHGFDGQGMQDALMFSATAAADGPDTVQAVLEFAEALENVWAG